MANSVVLSGRIVRDVEVQTVGDNLSKVSNVIATQRRGKKDEADFIPFTVFGKSAENLEKFSGKGLRIEIVGRVSARPYEDKNGDKKTFFEIIAQEVNFIDWKGDGEDSEPKTKAKAKPKAKVKAEPEEVYEDFDGDVDLDSLFSEE